jgi:hypothetical protein
MTLATVLHVVCTEQRLCHARPHCDQLAERCQSLSPRLIILRDTETMSTQVGGPQLLSRVAARAGLGIWRHRGGILVSAVVSAALVGYVAVSGMGIDPVASLTSVTTSANSDCADTAMAALTSKSPAATQSAYQCMDTSFQQRVTEQAFVQQMQQQRTPSVDKLNRVGDYHSPAGGTMVYYALDAAGQSVGYIVYLGRDGKVLKIE